MTQPIFTGAAFNGTAVGSSLISLLFCCVYIVIALIAMGLVVLWIWMLVDLLLRNENQFGDSLGSGSDAKIIWLILMLFTGGIASLLYYFLVFRKYPRK